MVEQSNISLSDIEQNNELNNNRAPKCARCRNHGMVNSFNGHEHFCKWNNCTCARFQVVVERQRITASRVASLRQQRKLVSDPTSSSMTKRNILRRGDQSKGLINLNNVKYLEDFQRRGFLDSGKSQKLIFFIHFNLRKLCELELQLLLLSQYIINIIKAVKMKNKANIYLSNFLLFISDDESIRSNSTGTRTPASISPPISPPLSVRSDDIDVRSRTTTTVNSKLNRPQSFCKDPNCDECLKISRFMFKTNLNKLYQQFPRVQLHEIEMALQRARGDLTDATRFLRNRELSTVTQRSLFKGFMPPSSPPTCNCQDCKDAILLKIESSSRKRHLVDETPVRQITPNQYLSLIHI